MRPRRQILQVSTFPFLAVLLCAMGSLILLLLVIDRRAKTVARFKALQAITKTSEADREAAAARRIEWERRKEKLHAELLKQDDAFQIQLRDIRDKSRSSVLEIEAKQKQVTAVRTRVDNANRELATKREQLKSQRDELTQTSSRAGSSSEELVRLTIELRHMEQTLQDLKAARKRQRPVFSLVPYSGKRGDSRKPLYIECAGDALIFHPDRLMLSTGPTLTPVAIRVQIDRRIEAQKVAAVGDQESQPNSYLLMLVRPDGIATYYRTLSALQGLNIDYGYEFVDRDWVLDFSNEGERPQSWIASTAPVSVPPRSAITKQVEGIDAGGRFSGTQSGGESQATRPSGIGGGSSVLPTSPQTNGDVAGSVGQFSPQGINSPMAGEARGYPGFGGQVRASGTLTGNGPPGDNSRSSPNGVPLAPGSLSTSAKQLVPAGSAINSRTAIQADGQGAARSQPGLSSSGSLEVETSPIARGAAGQGIGGSNSSLSDNRSQMPPLTSGAGKNQAEQGGGDNPMSFTPINKFGSGDAAKFPSESGYSSNQQLAGGGPNAAGASSPGNPSNPTGANTNQRPADRGSNGAGTRSPGSAESHIGGTNGQQAMDGASNSTGTHSSGNATDQGGESDGPAVSGPTDTLSAIAPRDPKKKVTRPTPLRSNWLNSNRDWVIQLDCTADGIVVQLTGEKYSIATTAENGPAALRVALEAMITRRQGTVRAGEAPYRPILKFRVHVDGWRAYYVTYPALESLSVSMIRENVSPEDEAKTKGQNR